MNEQSFSALEARLRHLEDLSEIGQLVSAYGPAVDSGNLPAMDGIWDENCIYDFGDQRFENLAQLKAGVSAFHSRRSNGGAAHFGTMPYIVIDGNNAWATHHSALILHESGGYVMARMSASLWTLARQPTGGWLVTSRINRLLDGSPEARAIFASAGAPGSGV